MNNRYIGQKTLLFTEKGEKITLTATTSREINYSADISENTVETGYVIADSVINKPITVQITQIISTTNERSGQNSNIFSYWQSIYNRLIDSRVLIKVQTSDYIYDNMILTSFSVKRSNKHLMTEITLNFKQVIIVSTSLVNMPKNYEYLKNIVTGGDEGTKDAETTNKGQLQASDAQIKALQQESEQNKSQSEQEDINVKKSILAGIPSVWDEVKQIFF